MKLGVGSKESSAYPAQESPGNQENCAPMKGKTATVIFSDGMKTDLRQPWKTSSAKQSNDIAYRKNFIKNGHHANRGVRHPGRFLDWKTLRTMKRGGFRGGPEPQGPGPPASIQEGELGNFLKKEGGTSHVSESRDPEGTINDMQGGRAQTNREKTLSLRGEERKFSVKKNRDVSICSAGRKS